MTNFNRYARYYDLLYKDKDYNGEANYVDRLIRRTCPTAKSILELGCGTGIHATLLATKGARVHGIDLSETMLASAEARRRTLAPDLAKRLTFAPGNVTNYRTDERFDAVVSLFHVASYQTSNENLKQLMTTATHHLNKGGVFVFDFWYGPTVLTDRPTLRTKQLEDDAISVVRIAKPVMHPNENRVDVHYHITITDKATGAVEELSEVHPMRYLFLPEVEQLLSESGFSSWHAEEWMTGKTPGFDTWGVSVTALK